MFTKALRRRSRAVSQHIALSATQSNDAPTIPGALPIKPSTNRRRNVPTSSQIELNGIRIRRETLVMSQSDGTAGTDVLDVVGGNGRRTSTVLEEEDMGDAESQIGMDLEDKLSTMSLDFRSQSSLGGPIAVSLGRSSPR